MKSSHDAAELAYQQQALDLGSFSAAPLARRGMVQVFFASIRTDRVRFPLVLAFLVDGIGLSP